MFGLCIRPKLQAEQARKRCARMQIKESISRSWASPFPASESILEECDRTDVTRPRRRCKRNKELLEEMAQEPREEPWASAAERALRAYAEQEPGKFTIRALDCRQSICFLEVASTFGQFAYPVYKFEKTSGLMAEYTIRSSEIDQFGGQVRVTLGSFVRTSKRQALLRLPD